MDLTRRELGAEAGLPGFHDRCQEILRIDLANLQHLDEAGVRLARAAAIRPTLRIRHSLHRFEGELRAVLALVRVHVLDHLLEVEVAEGYVARLVAQHVVGQLAEQGAGGLSAHVVEGGQSQPLDDHVHADHDLREVARRERRVDQVFQPGRDRVRDGELLDVAVVHLDVARLVHRLGRGVELGVVVRNRVGNRRGGHQGALLTV